MKKESNYTDEIIKTSAKKADIDISGYDMEEIRMGMAVELEHGSHDPETDVTGDDPVQTLKIVIAHLKELRDYYTKLKNMEKKKLDEAKRYRELAGVKENEIKKTLNNEQFIDKDELISESTIINEEVKFSVEEFKKEKVEDKEEDKELYSINESNKNDGEFIELDFVD